MNNTPISTQGLQAVTESFHNTHWVLLDASSNLVPVGLMASLPFDTLLSRLSTAILKAGADCEEITVLKINEKGEEIFDVVVRSQEEGEEADTEVYVIHPVWLTE